MKKHGVGLSAEAKKQHEIHVKRLKRLAAQGASVEWAGRRWFIAPHGLSPADRKWGDLQWKELGLGNLKEIEQRVYAERIALEEKSRKLRGDR